MLHLVNVTRGFNSEAAYEQASAQKKVRMAKGVYCDLQDAENMPAFLRTNALRIANYLYGNAVLIQASAHLKGMVEAENSTPITPKFKLFLAGTYFRVTEVTKMLEIVQFEGLGNKDLKRFCNEFEDNRQESLGPMTLMCASDELTFLQNFARRRGHLERFLPNDQMLDLRERLEKTYGEDLVSRLAVVVRQTGEFGAEFERAVQALRIPMDTARRHESPMNLQEFTIGWQRRPVAKLAYNGVNWSFTYPEGWAVPLQVKPILPGQTPAFIINLLPEGVMRDLLRARLNSTSTTLLENSERFMSNLSIVRSDDRLKDLPLDILEGHLRNFKSPGGVFNGSIVGLPDYSSKMMFDMSEMLTSLDMPRVAGMQPKIMMNLSASGEMSPALAKSATHILKFPGIEQDGESTKGVVEWASMTMAKGSGLPCADFALARIKGAKKEVLGYVTERFDIPQNEDDLRMILAEDICSVLGMPPEAKGMPSLNKVIESVKAVSTNPSADMEDLFRQIAVNYLLENADFHAKNASILKVANPMLNGFRSIRMAPAYDILRTRTFAAIPLKAHEREPMQLGFEDDKGEFIDRSWEDKDFRHLGHLCGLTIDRTDELLYECATGISRTAIASAKALPDVLNEEAFSFERDCVMEVFERAVEHCNEFFPDLPASLDSHGSPKSRSAAMRA